MFIIWESGDFSFCMYCIPLTSGQDAWNLDVFSILGLYHHMQSCFHNSINSIRSSLDFELNAGKYSIPFSVTCLLQVSIVDRVSTVTACEPRVTCDLCQWHIMGLTEQRGGGGMGRKWWGGLTSHPWPVYCKGHIAWWDISQYCVCLSIPWQTMNVFVCLVW